MSGRSIQELNGQLLGDFRFYNHSLKDYSSNGNDLSPVLDASSFGSTALVGFTRIKGMRCYQMEKTFASDYFTFPSAITGSFTLEALVVPQPSEDYIYINLITDVGGSYVRFDTLLASGIKVDFGSSAASESATVLPGKVYHIVYTRDIVAGPALDNQYAYINNRQLSFSAPSGTSDISPVSSLLSGESGGYCFFYKIYDDYLTDDEVNTLYKNAQDTLPNEIFPHYISDHAPPA